MNEFTHSPVYLLFFLVIFTLAPIFLMMVTSFVKTSIVFSILRNAIGSQQVPPNIVLMGFALILTLYIMNPVISQIKVDISRELGDINIKKAESWTVIYKSINAGMPVLKSFLKKNAHVEVLKMFSKLSHDVRRKEGLPEIDEDNLLILVPSFVVSELKEAFEIGVLVYLPFLVVDMLVSGILISMGMHMLSPVTVSLPFKLLIFVLSDGWELISRGIISGYLY